MRRDGFTLTEVMVSASLLSLVTGMCTRLTGTMCQITVLRTECGDASFQSAPDGDREDAWHRRRRHRRRETARRTAGEATFDRTPVTRMTFVV